MSRKPIVSIIGQTNVGKSTLFNSIMGKNIAIVEEYPGITRDRLYGNYFWKKKEFLLIDTGGLTFDSRNEIRSKIEKQTLFSISESDIIIFLVDGKVGVTPLDIEISDILRKSELPIIVAVNKIDGEEIRDRIYEFTKLGFRNLIDISAYNKRNTKRLLDIVYDMSKELTVKGRKVYSETDKYIKIALVGKSNVGKSSLVNALLLEERMIVDDQPFTTRDAVDSHIKFYGEDLIIIDTAGLRVKAKVKDKIEKYSAIRTIKAIERSDICILMIDVTTGISETDKKIANLIYQAGKACIIALNKWDAIEKETKTLSKLQTLLKKELFQFKDPNIIAISALTRWRIDQLLKLTVETYDKFKFEVQTSHLNKIIASLQKKQIPPMHNGGRLKIFYATQVGTKPPTFKIYVNYTKFLKKNYFHYIKNCFLKKFELNGIPIKLIFVNRK